MKLMAILTTGLLAASTAGFAQSGQTTAAHMENLELTQEWDKVFPQSDKVNHSKITFHNRYGITLAADLYIPKNAEGKLPAIAVSGPFGAVKEQASGLYAQTLAERGFLTIAFDPSYTGESGGQPRNAASPDINSGLGWHVTSSLSLINMPILAYSDEIRSAVLVVHGEQAHSRYFGEDAFKKLKGENKELYYIVPDASHTDLYDNLEKIPFDKIVAFYNQYLK